MLAKLSLRCVPCLLVISASCSSAGRLSVSDPLSVVTSANAALDSAYRHGDADAAAALLTDSVVLSAENIPDLAGRRTIRDLLTQFFAANSVQAFTLRPIEVQIFG